MDSEDMPFLASNEEVEQPTTLGGKEVVRSPLEGPERPKKPAAQVLHEELRASETWGCNPVIGNQEHVYPDTVKITETHVKVLDLGDTQDAALMAQIISSDKQRGRFVLAQSVRIEFAAAKGTYLALVMYFEREFKQFEKSKSQ